MADQIQHFIGGRRTEGAVAGRCLPVLDPSTGRRVAEVPIADQEVVDTAVDAASRALPEWSAVPLDRRQALFFRFRELLLKNRDELIGLVTRDHGKTLEDAAGEFRRGIEAVEYAAGLSVLLRGQFSRQVSTSVDTVTVREPVGVCVGITPFNFPIMVPLWMFPLAVGCGNTFVLKPSEQAPSAPALMAELFHEAGAPDGVLNVVHGDRGAAESLVRHPSVAAVSFIGSTPAAENVFHTGTQAGKRVQALGGAKNHMVVMPDADMDGAADAAVSAAFGSAGERCMAISVVLAVGAAADELVPRISDRIRDIRVGPGSDASSDMGPLISSEHRSRVLAYIDSGVEQGAALVVDGREAGPGASPDGYFVGPTLFDHVEKHMKIYKDEIFGPVLVVLRLDSLQEAVEVINQNPYGNGTAIFTASGLAAREFQTRVEVGMVGVNVPIPVPVTTHGFGGWKKSNIGTLGMYGAEGVWFYTRQKSVVTRWAVSDAAGPTFGFPMT